MSTPSDIEIDSAVKAACYLREHTEDKHYLGINMNYRFRYLQQVKQAAKLFLHSGESSHHHADLLKATAKSDQCDSDRDDTGQPQPW